MNLIEFKNATFAYKDDNTLVFNNFNLSLEKGKCLVIEGDNGSGKTTLFRLINGLNFLNNGKYFFDEQEINEKYLRDNLNSKMFHKKIGYLFQNPDVMLFNSTVYDEVAFGPRQMGLNENEIKHRVDDCIKLFSLETIRDKAPYHLSGGQKKKVALASIISLNPEVLILDEPFAGLDSKSQDNLMNFLIKMKKVGKTIIIATHNSIVREKIADQYLVLN